MSIPTTLQRLDSLRLTLFSGKGGVGKTTLACGFARRWAHQFPQESILLLSTDPAHSLGDVLQQTVEDTPRADEDLPNLQVRSLDAKRLLQAFKAEYGRVLELLVERGSFVDRSDLTPVWELGWSGLDELMGILEIQRILRQGDADRVVVDMAPSGHTLNLFALMDFLDEFLDALELFQEKHRVISQRFTGRYTEDAADAFLRSIKADLTDGRQLLQNQEQTACLVVAIAEPMSLLETQRFLRALEELRIPVGGIAVNRCRRLGEPGDRMTEQQRLLANFLTLANQLPVFQVPLQKREPVGAIALDHLMAQVQPVQTVELMQDLGRTQFPDRVPPGFEDFAAAGRSLLLVGGKGGVGKTTVAAAIGWAMAQRYPDRKIRVISIDPAHSLGDALGDSVGHVPVAITPNLTAQEIDAEQVLEQFRAEYLWELAAMMGGDSNDADATMTIAYGPQAWRKIVAQALPGIDELLSLVTVMELLESKSQDVIILDTAPTGHLLRFLEMPNLISDWLAWIFKLWIKYQSVLGRVEFMGQLRSLRQRVIQAQKKLQDPQHTEFIGVVQAQSAILAEAARLTESLAEMRVTQRYIVHNRFQAEDRIVSDQFPNQTIVRLPELPRSIAPLHQIEVAADLLFEPR